MRVHSLWLNSAPKMGHSRVIPARSYVEAAEYTDIAAQCKRLESLA